MQADCAASTFNGIYLQNRVLTASNTITMVIKNNSSSAKAFTPVAGNITLSDPAAAGMTVTSVSPSTATNIASGGTLNVVYTLSGTPTTAGSFTSTFTSEASDTCVKTGTVCLDIPITVSNTTAPSPLPSIIVAGNKITFNVTGGTPNTTGISWIITSSPATGVFSNTTTSGTGTAVTANLIAGTTGSVTVTFSATNTCGIIFTGSQTVYTGDGLRAALAAAGCASCTAYDNAVVNTWVQITAAEYTQIDNYVPVNIAGANEALMNAAPESYNYVGVWMTTGTSSAVLPANNYVIGFSALNATGAVSTNDYLKYSTSLTTGYSMSGPKLVIPSTSVNTRIYNIMKRPSTVVNVSSPNYIAIYLDQYQLSAINNISGTSSYTIQNADGAALNDTNTFSMQIQVKATATKKWQ